MEMEEDSKTYILLGRHFITTVGFFIDVKCGKLIFEVGDENIGFLLSKLMKLSTFKDLGCIFNVIGQRVMELSLEPPPLDGLEAYLIVNICQEIKIEEHEAYNNVFDESHIAQSQSFKILKNIRFSTKTRSNYEGEVESFTTITEKGLANLSLKNV